MAQCQSRRLSRNIPSLPPVVEVHYVEALYEEEPARRDRRLAKLIATLLYLTSTAAFRGPQNSSTVTVVACGLLNVAIACSMVAPMRILAASSSVTTRVLLREIHWAVTTASAGSCRSGCATGTLLVINHIRARLHRRSPQTCRNREVNNERGPQSGADDRGGRPVIVGVCRT
jgi:hypothetical protein